MKTKRYTKKEIANMENLVRKFNQRARMKQSKIEFLTRDEMDLHLLEMTASYILEKQIAKHILSDFYDHLKHITGYADGEPVEITIEDLQEYIDFYCLAD